MNISLGSTGWKDHAETITEETRGSRITAGRTAAVIAKEDMTVKGSTVNAQDIHIQVSWAFLFIANGKPFHPFYGMDDFCGNQPVYQSCDDAGQKEDRTVPQERGGV